MKPKVLTRLGKLISLSQQIFPVYLGLFRSKILRKSLSIFIIQGCLCFSVLIFGFSQGVLAQSGFFEEDNFNFETDYLIKQCLKFVLIKPSLLYLKQFVLLMV